MISILILTDDTGEWARKVRNSLNVLRARTASGGYHIENPLFTVDIMSDDVTARRRYSHIIIDKPVHQDFENIVLRSLISSPIIHTEKYFGQAK